MLTACLISVAVIAVTSAALLVLPHVGVDAEVVPFARAYVLACLPGVLPFQLYWAHKAWLQAHGQTRGPVIGVLLAMALLAFLDVLLVFGSPALGIPALGVVGAGIANSITNVVRLVVVAIAAERASRDDTLSGEQPPRSWRERKQRLRAAFVVAELLHVVRIGLPLGLQMALEVAVFAFAALMMGRMGAVDLAAHQVALQCASTTFSAMVGLGSAASVVVGRRIGAFDKRGALNAGIACLGLSVAFMSLTGAAFLLGGTALARLFTTDLAVVDKAGQLLMIAAAFQLSDGLQTVASGALRGAGDTRATFFIHLLSHWAVGMPCVLLLAASLGAAGVWWGLTLGLTVAAAALVLRFVLRARRGYEPLQTH